MRRNIFLIGCSLLAALIVMPSIAAEGEQSEQEIEGTVEVLFRNVSQDGSTRKFDEDFDGLDSGGRLSSLAFNWNNIDSSMIDYFRVDAGGLGGDPYQHAALRLGLKDQYDLRISHNQQSSLYNLFTLTPDQDASTWNTDRSSFDLGLTIHAADTIDVYFDFQEVQRDGSSFVMKDINTDLFQLSTPLDQNTRRYSVGARFEIGTADLLFRQTLRRNEYNFHNTTTGNSGLSMADLATLDQYDWVQQDHGDTDLTTLTFSMPFGDRVNLKATVFGTLLGEERIESQVSLDASGTSFLGTCSVTGATCGPTNPCSVTPGNVCVANPYGVSGGTSTADIEADYLALGGDISVRIADPLDFHLQIDSLNREITGIHNRDLDGNGVPDDTEGIINDPTPGSTTNVEYTLNTITGLLVYEPSSMIRVRAGYRTIDRDLDRSGFEYGTNDYRNTDYSSGSDDTLILGVKYKPVAWFKLDASYEQADVAQAFTAVSPTEMDRLRVRATLRYGSRTRFELGFIDFENSTMGFDFSRPGDCTPGDDVDSGCWNSLAEGTTVSASMWHKANDKFDFWVRWAEYDIDRVTRIHFDTDGFFDATDVGDSIYGNTNTAWVWQVNFNSASRWKAFFRAQINESKGENSITGSMYAYAIDIFQNYSSIEAGVTYTLPRDAYIGARVRSFEYDDDNDDLNYDGDIFTIVAGLQF